PLFQVQPALPAAGRGQLLRGGTRRRSRVAAPARLRPRRQRPDRNGAAARLHGRPALPRPLLALLRVRRLADERQAALASARGRLGKHHDRALLNARSPLRGLQRTLLRHDPRLERRRQTRRQPPRRLRRPRLARHLLHYHPHLDEVLRVPHEVPRPARPDKSNGDHQARPGTTRRPDGYRPSERPQRAPEPDTTPTTGAGHRPPDLGTLPRPLERTPTSL